MLFIILPKEEIKLPIIDAVYNILYNNGSVDNEIGLLMNRPLGMKIRARTSYGVLAF